MLFLKEEYFLLLRFQVINPDRVFKIVLDYLTVEMISEVP